MKLFKRFKFALSGLNTKWFNLAPQKFLVQHHTEVSPDARSTKVPLLLNLRKKHKFD